VADLRTEVADLRTEVADLRTEMAAADVVSDAPDDARRGCDATITPT